MTEEKNLISFLRDCNDFVKLITGKSIPDLAKRSTELFSKEITKKIIEEKILEPDSPYAILGIRPDASTLIIKATYRHLILKAADEKRSGIEIEQLRQAYLKILADRGEG